MNALGAKLTKPKYYIAKLATAVCISTRMKPRHILILSLLVTSTVTRALD